MTSRSAAMMSLLSPATVAAGTAAPPFIIPPSILLHRVWWGGGARHLVRVLIAGNNHWIGYHCGVTGRVELSPWNSYLTVGVLQRDVDIWGHADTSQDGEAKIMSNQAAGQSVNAVQEETYVKGNRSIQVINKYTYCRTDVPIRVTDQIWPIRGVVDYSMNDKSNWVLSLIEYIHRVKQS